MHTSTTPKGEAKKQGIKRLLLVGTGGCKKKRSWS